MKTSLLLIALFLPSCYRCAYGYSTSCGDTTPNQYEEEQQEENSKDKENKKEEKSPSIGWN